MGKNTSDGTHELYLDVWGGTLGDLHRVHLGNFDVLVKRIPPTSLLVNAGTVDFSFCGLLLWRGDVADGRGQASAMHTVSRLAKPTFFAASFRW